MYEYYQTLKLLHVLTVVFSLGMFSVRSVLMLAGSENYKHRYWRMLTAFNDSILLVLGGFLVYLNSILWEIAWFQEKMLFLILYILFGTLGLNRLKHTIASRLALILAFLCAIHMLSLALGKAAWLFG